MNNLGYCFSHDHSNFFRHIPTKSEIINKSEEYFKINNAIITPIELTTKYPGLIYGSGYISYVENNNDKFQIGFYFDYTTGLPVILGSSVKGKIKSVFPRFDSKAKYDHEKIKELYQTFNNLTFPYKKSKKFIKALMQNIFEEKKDKFFEAYVSSIENRLFDEDYITPHNDKITRNPTPLRFLRISSGVTFTFQFKFTKFEYNGLVITSEHKRKLFETILLDVGIGAKTNVGYGQFEPSN